MSPAELNERDHAAASKDGMCSYRLTYKCDVSYKVSKEEEEEEGVGQSNKFGHCKNRIVNMTCSLNCHSGCR